MEGNVSLGVVVQTIMESLGDAIAQLMLYVLALKESNSAMPAHIPQAVEGVTTASNTLADVASSIADEEYEGYPEIQTPIHDAAKDVRSSGKNLIAAVSNLKSGSNRAAGWEYLLDASQIISGQTCVILQLVYGAELKKLMFAALAASQLGGNTPASMAAKDPQKFADQVGELAGMAEALAANLADKMRDEESPLRREEMKKQIEILQNMAQEIPALGNQVLAKPSDVKNHQPFDNKMKEFAKILAEISEPFKQKLDLLPDRPPKISPITPTPGPISPPAQRKVKTDPPSRSVDPPIPSSLPNVPPEPTYNPPPIPPQATKTAKDDVKRLIAAAAAKDTPKLVKEAQMLPASVSPLVEALENQARASHDTERVEQLQKTIEELKRIVPKIVTIGAQALKDPSIGTQQLQKTQQQFDTLADYAQQLSAPANDVQVAALAKKILTELPKLKEPPKVETASRNLGNLLPFLSLPTKELIARTVNPQTKAKLTEALKNIENAVPESINTAKASAKNASDVPTRKKLEASIAVAEAALHDLINNTGTDVLAHARKQTDDAGILDVFATLERPAEVSTTEKKIVARQPEIVERALEIAATSPDNHVKEDIAKNVARLEQMLPEQIKTAHEVVKKPEADEPKRKLKQSTQEMAKALHNIATDVQKVPPTSTPLRETPPTMQDIVDAVNAAKDPKGEANLKKLLDKVAPALEKILEQLDEDEAVLNYVNDLGIDLGQALAKLSTLSPEDPPKKFKEIVDVIVPIIPKIVEAMKPYVEDDPLLADALGDLAALGASFVSAAEEVAKNPRGPAKKKMDAIIPALAKNVKFVIGKAKPPPEVETIPQRKFKKNVAKVVDMMDDPGLDFSKLRDLLKSVDRGAKAPPANNDPNYLGNRKIAEAVAALDKELADKGKRKPDVIASKPFQDAKKVFQDFLADAPKPSPVAQAREVAAILDRLDAAASSPNSDPRKFENIAKALEKNVAPLIQAAKKEAEKIKDPEAKKQADLAIKELEKTLPRLIDEGIKPVIKNPTPENKEKLKEQITEVVAPLEQLIAALAPNPAVDLGKRAKQEALKLANAAKKGDPKAADAAAKALKDLNDKLIKAARDKAAQAPAKVKGNIDQNIKQIEEQTKALDPIILQFAKNPKDDNTKSHLEAAANNLVDPIEMLVQNLEFAPHATKAEQEQIIKQIVATMKSKDYKKLDPSNLLKISKHLAGLLSDMVQKTGDELHNGPQSALSDRARAALELERLLASLDKDASAHRVTEGNTSQSIDSLLGSLNLSGVGSNSGGGGGGAQTHLSQEISSVAKQIRTRTSGSIEGSNLHNISQGLAADLQKFADADSGNSRSELIVLGRAISANIVRLADELKRLAASCTDPKMQEKLLMNAQVLRNYSTQLKIMASVRAASPKTSRDSSSDQLVILSQNLAAVIGDATNAVSIIKQTKKGQV